MERKTIADLVLHFPEERADEKVLVFLNAEAQEERSFSFRQLKEESLRVAHYLHSLRLADKVVPIVIDNQADFVLIFFGCILAGLVPVPLPAPKTMHDLPAIGQLLHILNENGSHTVIASDKDYPLLLKSLEQAAIHEHNIISTGFLLTARNFSGDLPIISAGDIAYLQYTSGSTLQPKGVVLRNKNVLANLAQMYRVFNREKRVRVAGWIPFHHDMGLVGHLFTVLFESGFGVFMPPSAFIARPALWLTVISKYTANSAAAPTFAFEHCCRKINPAEIPDLSCWKYAYVGSEPVSLQVLDNFHEKFAVCGFSRNSFKPVYGLAEATLLAAGGGLGLDELDAKAYHKRIRAGQSRELVAYSIEDETRISIHHPGTGEVQHDGEEGEIWLYGESVGSAYAGNTATNGAFKGAGVKTGDMGFINNGFVYITGRYKDIVIQRGVNYAAEDLELAARYNHELLSNRDLTVCVSHNDAGKEAFFVFQEVHRHRTATEHKEIADRITNNLAQTYGIVPHAVILLNSGYIPRTRNHKVSRRSSLQEYLSGNMKTLYVAGPAVAADIANDLDDIAIVGMACRFPGNADSPEKFWELIANGVDAITEIPPQRWDSELCYDPKPAVPGKMNTRWAGFIDKIDHFDPALFGISSYEAPEIDPQQRLLLETSWRLLENSGWKKEALAGSETGVYIGISTNDYLYMKIKLIHGMESFNAYSGLGNANSVAANRLSYFYDLKGPSLAVDTACSSSLTAFHLGATAILNGDCKQAIVGGVNAILSPGPGITLSQFGMMSPQGRCKTFDAAADGYVRAEGCGLVMLKRHSDALRDGDRILAIVKASASGQDGHSPGITFPNGEAQRKLLEKTLRKAGSKGADISYIETHGTGTAAGDPVEMEQLARIYGASGEQTCYVGSVKANIGHLEAAAGIASVIKAVLILEKNKVPPQIHFTNLNPRIELKGTRFSIPTSLYDWEKSRSGPNKIAVSSFGFGGSLAHVILEQAREKKEAATADVLPHYQQSLFVLSAHSPESLFEQAETWIDWLQHNHQLTIHDICFSQATGRSFLKYRQYFLVGSTTALVKKLEEFIKLNKTVSPNAQVKTAFLCTGQGDYYQNMGKELYHHFPAFADAFNRCAAVADEELDGFTLYQLAFESSNLVMQHNRYIQPVTFAVQYALGILLEAGGCIPNVLLGHSFGEYAAACLAGCFEPETGMKIVRKRGELIDGLPAVGTMAVIFCGAGEIIPLMDASKICIAAINSSRKTVVSGDAAEIRRLADIFNDRGIASADIKAQQAFHSFFMDPVLNPFLEYLAQFSFRPPSRKWISSLTGEVMEQAPGPAHWVAHLRNKVDFEKAVQVLEKETVKHFIEIGPGSGTLLAVSESMDCSDSLLLRTLNVKKGDRTETYFLFDTIGQMFRSGMNLQFAEVLSGGFYPQQIPGQKFKHASYWMQGLNAEALSAFTGTGKALQAAPAISPDSHYDIKWTETQGFADTILSDSVKDINWIIIGNNGALAENMIHTLRSNKAHVFHISTFSASKGPQKPDIVISDEPDKEECRKALDTIVNFKSRVNITDWRLLFISGNSFSTASPVIENEMHKSISLLLPLLQALYKSIPVLRLWLVTEMSQMVPGMQKTSELNLAAAVVWGFGKTLFLEHPEWRGGMIDTDADGLAAETILKKVSKPGPGGESAVAMRSGRHFIQQLFPAEKLAQPPAVFRNDGAYLVTGGLGGLGLQSAAWLAGKGANHIILLSRKQFPAANSWPGMTGDDPNYAIAQQLLALTANGIAIETVAADIRDRVALQSVFTALDNRKIPVRGVIHAAGVNWFSKIMELDKTQLLETLRIKTSASLQLHDLTAQRDLDCFILFSSVSALWGSVDLSHYTAANHFMDMFSIYRASLNLKSCSINWGPWAEVGMSSAQREKSVLEKLGFTLLPPPVALAAMDIVLAAGSPLSLIADIDWRKFRLFSDFSLQPSLFNEVTHVDVNEKRHMQHAAATIRAATPDKARSMIEEAVRTELRMVMLIESMDAIDSGQRFNFLGMDSLMAITFVVQLEEYFECKLPGTLVYNYPTIQTVCDYLFEVIYGGNEAAGQIPALIEPGVAAAIAPARSRMLLKQSTAERKVTLFCFPYAGSGASAYTKWVKDFNGSVEIIAIQTPGREERSAEQAFTCIGDIIAEIYQEHIDPNGEFYFFGHSLGALIAYEFYAALKKHNRKLPDKLFLCGCGAPLALSEAAIHQLDGDAFIDAVVESYGDPGFVAERRSAIENNYLLLKRDIQVLETYQSTLETIDIPLVAVCGIEDRLAPPAEVEKWSQLARKQFHMVYLDGGHNLLNDHGKELANIIASGNEESYLRDHHPKPFSNILNE